MPDDRGRAASDFVMYRSADSVLIRTTGGEIELTLEAADRLARELSGVTPLQRTNVHWTPLRFEELRRLYQDEWLPLEEIAQRLGISRPAVSMALRRARIPRRRKHGAVVSLAASRRGEPQ